MEKWFIKNKKFNHKKIAQKFGISEFLSKLIVNRDITDYELIDSFINPRIEKFHSPKLMKDITTSIQILKEKITEKKKILIVGDFDVDGVMSTFILYTGIKKCGGIVDFVIPDRVMDGYGINDHIILQAKDNGVDTIITCDNGIAAINQIKLAKQLDLTIIVTDHHDVPFSIDELGDIKYTILEADSVINPKQIDCEYPFKSLCGAGIAFKLIQELYIAFNEYIDQCYELLEFAAIATVCDVVDLVGENRIIVKKGLELINNTNNIGLKALVKEVGLEEKEITVYHLGFIIGPCINASGRLDSALLALELLLCKDEERAIELSKTLKELNEERKYMTQKGVEKIKKSIEDSNFKNDKIFVVYEPSIHESIAGIIAGRIKELYHKPTIVLTDGKDGVKGSGRSIEGYNMFEELSKIKHLFNRFGGHEMAAGLSLDKSNISSLKKLLNENTSLTDEDLIPKKYIDMQLPFDYIGYNIVNDLKLLEPFGKGNAKPVFGEKNLKVNRIFILGANKNVLKLVLESKSGKTMNGVYFGDIEGFTQSLNECYGKNTLDMLCKGLNNQARIDILFNPSLNEYNGNTELQVIIQSYRWNKE